MVREAEEPGLTDPRRPRPVINRLDGRTPFFETEEREDLFAALDHIVLEAEAVHGQDLAWARESLASGVEAVRDW